MTTPFPIGEGISIDAQAFAAALDDLVTQPELRDRLERDPVATLPTLGVQIPESARAELAGRRLSEMIPREVPGTREAGAGQVAETYVHVGVDVAVSVVVGVLVAAEVEDVQREIQSGSIRKLNERTTGPE